MIDVKRGAGDVLLRAFVDPIGHPSQGFPGRTAACRRANNKILPNMMQLATNVRALHPGSNDSPSE